MATNDKSIISNQLVFVLEQTGEILLCKGKKTYSQIVDIYLDIDIDNEANLLKNYVKI